MIPAIVLAAGKSVRMGRSKALLPLGPDETFLTRIVRTLREAEVEDVVVVTGHDADRVLASMAHSVPAVRLVVNPDYESGQLTSLVAGLRTVDRPGVVAVLVTLVDVPLVSAATVRAVVQRYRRTHAPIVRPVRAGRHGHPVLIDRALFDEISRADPAEGAKPVVRAHATAAGDVDVDDDGAFLDVDTPADYEAVMEKVGRR